MNLGIGNYTGHWSSISCFVESFYFFNNIKLLFREKGGHTYYKFMTSRSLQSLSVMHLSFVLALSKIDFVALPVGSLDCKSFIQFTIVLGLKLARNFRGSSSIADLLPHMKTTECLSHICHLCTSVHG